MAIHTYDASVGVYIRMLSNLLLVLDKGAEYATAKKFEPGILLTARLAPDMWSTAEQARSACAFSVRSLCRVTGREIPTYDGKDSTFDEVKARITWAMGIIRTFDRAALEGAADRTVTFPAGSEQVTMTGSQYLLTFALPNFFFHVTTVYDILRHNGVPLVKDDYMGKAGT